MSTEEAFANLLNDEYLWKRTGLSDSRRRSMKSQMAQDKMRPTLDKQVELLEKAGFYKKQDIDWGLRGGFVKET